MTPLMNIYSPKILPCDNYNHIMHDSSISLQQISVYYVMF